MDKAKDTVFIKQLTVLALVGVRPQERQSQQKLIIDAEMVVDIAQAASTDDLQQAVDYAAVCQVITAFAADSAFYLLETLADRLAAHLLNHFTIDQLTLSITKQPADMPDVQGVGVVVNRAR